MKNKNKNFFLKKNNLEHKGLTKGNSEFHTNKSGIVAARWLHSKDVLVISNCHKQSITFISRKKKDGSKICVKCPEVIANYNKTMGVIDLSDQKVGTYDYDHGSSMWWKVFYRLLLSAAVNAHVLYQQVNYKNTKLITFIVNLAE